MTNQSRAANRISNGGVSQFALVCPGLSFFSFLSFWDFPDFGGDFPSFWGDFLFLFFGLLEAPTKNIPERVRDSIRSFPEKVGKPPVWKRHGLASLIGCCQRTAACVSRPGQVLLGVLKLSRSRIGGGFGEFGGVFRTFVTTIRRCLGHFGTICSLFHPNSGKIMANTQSIFCSQ